MSAFVYRHFSPLTALLISLLASVGLLAGAHLFERVGGLAPCLLCLEQREVHWIAAGVGIISLVMWKFSKSERLLAAGLGALALVYVFSTWLSGFHAGVEWGFWPGPAACAAGTPNAAMTGADILAGLEGPGPAGPPCEVAAWRMLGISMAGYNALISLALGALCGVACFAAWRMQFSASSRDEAIA